MFDGLTMVNIDGQMPNKMMVDHGLMVTLSQGHVFGCGKDVIQSWIKFWIE